jgi:hypothetical protein
VAKFSAVACHKGYKKIKFYKMDKKILLKEMYMIKDTKRKRMLFELYAEQINLRASSNFVAHYINKELGTPNLVSQKDVEYCRFYYKRKNAAKTQIPILSNTSNQLKQPVSNVPIPKYNLISEADDSEKITWTNPDEISKNPYKSKF